MSLPHPQKSTAFEFHFMSEAVLIPHPQTFPCDPDLGISCVLLLPLLAWPGFSKLMLLEFAQGDGGGLNR